MKSIKQQFIDLREGKMTQHNFMRNIRMVLPQYITNVTSFKDSIKILKNKGILNECECDINNINLNEKNLDVDPKELQKGIEVEMEHTDDPVKAEQIALDHLAEDPQYYTKLATIEPEHSGDPSLKGGMAHLARSLSNPFSQYTKLKENAGIFNDLEQAKKEAQRMSDDEGGVAKHVDDNGDGTYSISDWYDADSTIASFGLGLDENDTKQPDNTIKKIDQSELSFLKKLYAKTPTEKIKKMIDDLEKTYKPLKEAKDEKGKGTNVNGKSIYSQFKEIDNLNGQEILIGINYEMVKNHELTKVAAAKIVIKNLKKNPIYYTALMMSGEENYKIEHIGGKSAQPEARKMQPVGKDNHIDNKMGMKPVKNIEKPKKDAGAKKETNSIVKGVEELTHKSLRAKGIKGVMDMTGGKIKKIHIKELKNSNTRRKIDESTNTDKTYAVYELYLGQPTYFWNEEKDDFIWNDANRATLYTKEEAENVRKQLLAPRIEKYQQTGRNYQEIHIGDLYEKGFLKKNKGDNSEYEEYMDEIGMNPDIDKIVDKALFEMRLKENKKNK